MAKKIVLNKKKSKKINSKKEFDLETEWKKMKKNLEEKLEIKKSENDEKKEINSTFEFEQFIHPLSVNPIVEGRLPILEKIDSVFSGEISSSKNFEFEVGEKNNPRNNPRDNIENKKSIDYTITSKREEIPYLRSDNTRPSVLTITNDTKEFKIRNKIFNNPVLMSEKNLGEFYPKILSTEKEEQEKYYKRLEGGY